MPRRWSSENGEHPVISAIDARHDHVYFQVVSGNGAIVGPAAGRAARRRRSPRARFGAPHLVGNAAAILADRWPPNAPPPVTVDPQPAPDIAWVAWLGAAVDSGHRAGHGRIICARPTPSRKPALRLRIAAADRRHDGVAVRAVERRPAPWSRPQARATRRAWRNCTAPRFTAAGARANSRSMLRERNTLVAPPAAAGASMIGFAVSRIAADEAEILSIAVAASHRGRGLSRDLLLTHLGHLAGRGVRTVFLEVEENNQPARRLYERAGFSRRRTPRTLLSAGRAANN